MENAEDDISGDIQKLDFDPFAAMNQTGITDLGTMKRHPLANRPYLISEKGRPDQSMPIFEDDHGTYIMNSKDLRAVEHVQRLAEIGVDSLKIEGRTKSHYYVARTTQIYRQAIDDAAAGRPFNPELFGKLEGLANRGYTDGFYQRHHTAEHQNYIDGNSKANAQLFVGEFIGYDDERGMAKILAKNKIMVGDELELILPTGNRRFKVEKMLNLKGQPVEQAAGGGHEVMIPLEKEDFQYGLLAKYL